MAWQAPVSQSVSQATPAINGLPSLPLSRSALRPRIMHQAGRCFLLLLFLLDDPLRQCGDDDENDDEDDDLPLAPVRPSGPSVVATIARAAV